MCHVYTASYAYSYRKYTRQQFTCTNSRKLEQKGEVPACLMVRCVTLWCVASGAETLSAVSGWAGSSGAHTCSLAKPRATSCETFPLAWAKKAGVAPFFKIEESTVSTNFFLQGMAKDRSSQSMNTSSVDNHASSVCDRPCSDMFVLKMHLTLPG